MLSCLPLKVLLCELGLVGVLYEVKKEPCMETAPICVFATWCQQLNRLSYFYVKFGIGVLYKKLSSAGEFRGDRLSDSRTFYLRE
jgi:hypothetical protein